MIADSFTTEFGHTIPFVPGYFERNKGYAYYAKGASLHHGLQRITGEPLGPTGPLKDWVEFSTVISFMERYGLKVQFRTGIDLGGAEGTCIRMFKAAGVIERAFNLDIDDYSAVVNDAYFASFIDRYARSSGPIKPGAEAVIINSKFAFDHFHEQAWKVGLHTDFPNSSALDGNFHMGLLDAPGTYDFVTSFCCFDYLDVNKAFSKVRSLLNSGGLFVGVLEYWWWPVNSTGILGHFPYAGQRLSFSDLKRYYAEFHPDLMENLDKKYHYFHQGNQRPTISQLFDLARENDLRPVAVERIIPKSHQRLPDCPPGIFVAPWFDHREVLRDIHHLNTEVGVDDLFTSAIKIAMVCA